MDKKLLLTILDGWGLATHAECSAIDKAQTPFIDKLYVNYPHSRLEASGLAVGLPEGQMGNSEVGHMNIGAGRVAYQELVRINKAIASKALHHNSVLLAAFDYAQQHQKKVHFMGLVSDGGVHAHIEHLKALCSIAKDKARVFIHAFTDGRDTSPQRANYFLESLEKHLEKSTGQIASIIGRYYAMDRDRRWERIKVAYDALVHGQGEKTQDWRKAIKKSYEAGVTDEFIKPILLTNDKRTPLACVEEGDVVLCFNFRPDRSRQITQVLTQTAFPRYTMKPLHLYYITFTNYQENFKHVHVLFEKEVLKNTLGEVLSKYGKKQIRIAETEKYPHVTYFFSGRWEAVFEGEEGILCPSPKVPTYDLQPEMSAFVITEKIIPKLAEGSADFVCLNFANLDMVGHTGVFEATVKAGEVVDQCLEKVVCTALKNDYAVLIIADHGNADRMCNEDDSLHTAHTSNPVPCIFVANNYNKSLKDGKLADVAPTILQWMGIAIPAEMKGRSLIEK
ncbi:MAG: 2,3-bisphosphoglycerate-independent phosphoglycerate mutase [Cytophagales bacterium]|nr:2,3-bisphosphoglycerate-independent phosphoglycerate mutase [Cytophagales bacterium]